ncbi:MAG TPA: AMP-binding protein [Phenylobacterium sp.]|uniref:class I adenylate-forming enzyme family protein n=1 Tax=Phenylobacterium sp. TaxID=1871053 RepID=UPI002B47909A|nr:AMP-binding protein [Phenylobacterium sp.]HKR90406.1 AMP-binding protein [Phenylobacterium sp.]
MSDHVAETRLRPWLNLYGPGLPADVPPGPMHVLDLYRAKVHANAENEAIRYFDASLSYRDIEEMSDAFAVWLQDRGVRPGARVGVILQNVPHFVIVTLAVWKIGAIPVPGNPMYRADELSRIFADYQPAAVVCHDDHHPAVAEAIEASGVGVLAIATVSAHDLQNGDDARLLPPRAPPSAADLASICADRSRRPGAYVPCDPSSIGLILYTSGTTGVPKGAVISHASLASNIRTSLTWMRVGPASRILALAPFFHITGFVLHMGLALAAGCSMAVHYRFQPEAVLDIIRDYRPTFTIAAITAYNSLMNSSGVTAADFRSFSDVFTGGAPVAPALRDVVLEKLGIDLRPVYGLTESCSPTHIAPPGLDIPIHAETGALAVGFPISSTECRIVGPDGKTLGPGLAGEIWIRGPQVMTGYWNKPMETKEALYDGWLRTGDVGVMNEAGWFFVVDRQKDMINASGFKVWPGEVEAVLLAHGDIREAAVVGAPDSYRGETVHAFVSLVPGADPGKVDEASLVRYCRERLAAYKVPRRFWFMEDLPKTPTGKIIRAALREKAAQDHPPRLA